MGVGVKGPQGRAAGHIQGLHAARTQERPSLGVIFTRSDTIYHTCIALDICSLECILFIGKFEGLCICLTAIRQYEMGMFRFV